MVNKPYTLTDCSLQWLLGREVVTSALVGVNSVEQVESNIKALEIEIPRESIDILGNSYLSR
ncbi:MAG: aldo/keto reductase [Nitrospinae bacterium]|nr:aldo/keto reductase [Nitrospinota bacterium]